MKKKYPLFFVINFLIVQNSFSIDKLSLFKNKDVFYCRSMLSPVFLTDTLLLSLNQSFIRDFSKLEEPNYEFSTSLELGLKKTKVYSDTIQAFIELAKLNTILIILVTST